ncbi:MAG TPA: VanZ family protein [Flavipsychrobacter sp.]|nr:VanZ family protein [Flavipsychrobacter sp.]
MLLKISDDPKHKRRARLLAILWTLLIFFLCFLPSGDVPEVRLPLIDKWAHFILFAVFAYLWLLSIKGFKPVHLLIVFLASVILGWVVEWIQGSLTFLGRSQDNMDTLADALGGLIGTVLFFIVYSLRATKLSK